MPFPLGDEDKPGCEVGTAEVVSLGDEPLRGALLLTAPLRLCFSRGNEGVNPFSVPCLLWDLSEP